MNILLVISDDWSPIAGCYGDPVVRTPHIDRLAARGKVFTNAFCTTPSCAASRANLLTGMYSHQHRQFGHSHAFHHFTTRGDAATLPSILNRAGIASGLAGKAHIAPPDVYPFTSWQEQSLFSNRSVTDGIRQCLIDIGNKPFYLHAASGYPHRTGGDFKRDVHFEEFEPNDVTYRPEEMPVPAWLPDTPEVRADLAEYYRFITRFDQFVGSTLETVEKAGRMEDTMVVLLSDHGLPFPGAKASPFEAGHHCPLIVATPDGTGAGQRCDALVNWCDVLPTILEAMEVPGEMRPEGSTGKSLFPLLENSQAPWRETTCYSHAFHEVTNYFPYRIVRGKRYKYVRCLAHQLPMPLGTDLFDSASYKAIQKTGGSPVRPMNRLHNHWPEALFDLENDPYETENLIDRSDLQSLADAYRNQLTELRRHTEDPWLEIDHQEGIISGFRN